MSTIHRARKGHLRYRTYLRANRPITKCEFCALTPKSEQIVTTHKYFREILNIFPYTLWDSSKVIEHTMIIPKRHVTSLSDLDQQEKLEYITLISAKESEGYDVFSRGHNSKMKSVPHQHTHVIKTSGKKIKTLLYHESPLITLHRY